MMSNEQDQEQSSATEDSEQEVDFHGAAIIDENGNEVAITEEMIKDACEKLDPGSTEVRLNVDEEE